ncbi:MAG: hypothetical protein ABI175_10915 [Polyangiales bacterium]
MTLPSLSPARARLSRLSLLALLVSGTCAATVACGRVGLDADGFEIDGSVDPDAELDSGFVDVSFDSGVRFDTGVPPFDTGFVDSTVFVDTGLIDTGRFFDTRFPDEGIDTARFDTGRPDTAGFDTARGDTLVFDTRPDGLVDTGVVFDTDFDTGVVFDTDFDTGVIFDTDFDTGVIFDTRIDVAPVEGGITCGPTTCNAATEICCAGFGTFSCTAPGACGGTPLSCSSAASCKSGNVCCFNGGGGAASATCQPFCFGGVQLCAGDAECRPPQICRPVFGGFNVCR